jgi:hypothetical protein
MIFSGFSRADALIGACSRFKARAKTNMRVVQRKSGPTMERGVPGISRAVYTTSRIARKTTLKPIAVPILPATLWSPKMTSDVKYPGKKKRTAPAQKT